MKTRRDYLANKEKARALVHDRLMHFNSIYYVPIKKIAIRNQKTRWGSCSRKGTLSFNYKIVYLKPELADYLIVHELCHLKEFNHSKRFWDQVAITMPNYKALQQELRRTHF